MKTSPQSLHRNALGLSPDEENPDPKSRLNICTIHKFLSMLTCNPEYQAKHIFIDEVQDVEALLSEPGTQDVTPGDTILQHWTRGHMWVCRDPNQFLGYKKNDQFEVKKELQPMKQFILTTMKRFTKQIGERVVCPLKNKTPAEKVDMINNVSGPAVHTTKIVDVGSLRGLTQTIILKLDEMRKEIEYGQITVLLRRESDATTFRGWLAEDRPDLRFVDGLEFERCKTQPNGTNNTITVESVYRYKGSQNTGVLLCDWKSDSLNPKDSQHERNHFYVALSRAKTHWRWQQA